MRGQGDPVLRAAEPNEVNTPPAEVPAKSGKPGAAGAAGALGEAMAEHGGEAEAGAPPPGRAGPELREEVVAGARALARRLMAGNDASHDHTHAERVWATARTLARLEDVDGAPGTGPGHDASLVVELAALLHDVCDHKYPAGLEERRAALHAFLDGAFPVVTPAMKAEILSIHRHMGFKASLAGGAAAGGEAGGFVETSRTLAVVQDADRLEALGAIGVARCFTFGGAKNRTLHDPDVAPRDSLTAEEYGRGGAEQTTINHFYEKLLRLQDLMRTDAGRDRARQRTLFMEGFLEQFHAEWRGER